MLQSSEGKVDKKNDRLNSLRPRLWVVIVYVLIILLYLLDLASTIYVMIAMRASDKPQIMTAGHELPQSDFAMFWYSGKQIIMNFANTHGGHWQPSAWMLATFQIDIVQSNHPFLLTWLYPPTMALLAALYALLPLALSFWVWRGIYCFISAYLLRRVRVDWWIVILGLGSPAGLHDMVGGQNGTLTGGILVSALLLIDIKPRLAGTLAGLLSIKPQLGIFLPLILLAKQRRKALFACVISIISLVVITFPLMGWPAWRWFLLGSSRSSVALISTSLHDNFPAAGITVFFMAHSLGASVEEAWILQFISSLVSGILLWKTWQRTDLGAVEKTALTLTLTILMTPYGYLYDLVGFSVAMLMMVKRAKPHLQPVFWLLWLFAGYTGPLANLTGAVLMPVAAALGVIYMWFFVCKGMPDYDYNLKLA